MEMNSPVAKRIRSIAESLSSLVEFNAQIEYMSSSFRQPGTATIWILEVISRKRNEPRGRRKLVS